MDYDKERQSMIDDHKKALALLEVANDVNELIKPHLKDAEWNTSFVATWDGFIIMSKDGSPDKKLPPNAQTLPHVQEMLEKTLNIKMKRDRADFAEDSSLYSVDADGYYIKDEVKLHIKVREWRTGNCKIEWEEVKVKRIKKMSGCFSPTDEKINDEEAINEWVSQKGTGNEG